MGTAELGASTCAYPRGLEIADRMLQAGTIELFIEERHTGNGSRR